MLPALCRIKPFLINSAFCIVIIGCTSRIPSDTALVSQAPVNDSMDDVGLNSDVAAAIVSSRGPDSLKSRPQGLVGMHRQGHLPLFAASHDTIFLPPQNVFCYSSLNSPMIAPQPAESVSEWSKPAPWISIFALAVSITLAFYARWKDSRARRHSIDDDYWLRKVVGPVVIEPLLKDILEMAAATPEDKSTSLFKQKAMNSFHDTYSKKLAELALASSSLQLINDKLATDVSSAVDAIQDILIEYCGSQQSSTTAQKKSDFQISARAKLMDLLRLIKRAQASLR